MNLPFIMARAWRMEVLCSVFAVLGVGEARQELAADPERVDLAALLGLLRAGHVADRQGQAVEELLGRQPLEGHAREGTGVGLAVVVQGRWRAGRPACP